MAILLYSDKSTTPSGFTLKLRKHVRNKRLEDVHMLGYDRVLFQLLFLSDNICSQRLYIIVDWAI
jgi:predicted ribosome quality control (RQC) complex YloA/Tae2 family protein